MTIDEYLGLVEKYHEEKDYLPALEVSDQLAFLRTIIPSKVIEISKKFHRTQLRILELKTDENSVMLRGIMASRLAMVDDDYANELGGHFDNYDKTDPDMRDAVLIAYARAYPNFESIVEKYRGTDSDEERVRFLSALVSLKDPALVAQSLGFALSGEVKRQDVRTMIVVATRNTEAREVSWSWLKFNLSKLRNLYEGTAAMSRVLLAVIPILGIGNVEEVEMFFSQNKVPEAEKGILAGLERLRIYNNLVESL
jgi:tricorn protease interacting factor F2/3